MHKIDLDGSCNGGGPFEVQWTEEWHETTYGEGPTCFYRALFALYLSYSIINRL
jgi:hypothetical protein